MGSMVKNMPGLQHVAGARAAVMQDVRRVVEDPADAMAAEVAHHGAALGLDIGLDGVADVAEARARLHRGDAARQSPRR